jgi:hypothetical protein
MKKNNGNAMGQACYMERAGSKEGEVEGVAPEDRRDY